MKYISIAKMGFKNGFVYNWSVFFSIFTSIISVVILNYFWRVLYPTDDIQYKYMVNYAIISQILSLFYSIQSPSKLSASIRNGSISIDLLRPWNYIFSLFAEDLGRNAVKVITVVTPIIFVAIIFFKLVIPSFISALFFLICVSLSFLLLFLIKTIVSMVCFWIVEAWSMLILIDVVVKLLSGQFLPDWIVPKYLKNIMEALPFIWIYQKPIQIYLTDNFQSVASYRKLIFIIAMQIIWITILFLFLLLIWKRAIKKLVIQGG